MIELLQETDTLGEVLLLMCVGLGYLGYRLVHYYFTKDKPKLLGHIDKLHCKLDEVSGNMVCKIDETKQDFNNRFDSIGSKVDETLTDIRIIKEDHKNTKVRLNGHSERLRKVENNVEVLKERTTNHG